MNPRWRYVGMAAIIVTASPAVPAIAAPSCSGPLEIVEARPAAIKAAVLSTGKTVLTFSGYSGAEYEDPAALRAAVVAVLEGHDPAGTLVNIGATQVGIGAAYELAKGRGFSTMGIVSSLARDEQVPFAPCVDVVFLDAIKSEYPEYWKLVRPLIAPGGLIIADNVLGSGDWWIDDASSDNLMRAGADRFNRLVASDTDFEAVAVPLRQGVLIGRRKS